MLALIGLDSVSLPVVDRLVGDGRMPTFEALRRRGQMVSLETPGTYFTAGSYPTLWTGVEVQDHGLYYPFLWSADEQRVVVAATRPSPPAIWERVHAAGGRLLVIDPYEGRRPTSDIPTCLSGVQFENRVVLERWGSPGGSLRQWERRIGRGGAAQEVFGAQSARRLLRLSATLLGASDRAAALVEAALAQEAPDLLITMLPAVHMAGHQLWDPAAVLPRGDVPDLLARRLGDVYASADAALGRILAALPGDADVIVASVLGMAANVSRNEFLPAMLEAVLTGGVRGRARSSAWRIRSTVPTGLRAAVADLVPDRVALELAVRAELRGVDWGTTRAFCVPSDAHGLIRVNLRGRERHGIVPDDELPGLLDEVGHGLLSFEDSDGSAVVKAVTKTQDALPAGTASASLPDLIVHWSDRPAVGTHAVTSSRYGTIARPGVGTGRSGNHTDSAWALVLPGRSRVRVPDRPLRVGDLAHTALSLCGAASEGEPMLEAVVA